ncbi:unnamed protein product, partial [Mycena citricolor]
GPLDGVLRVGLIEADRSQVRSVLKSLIAHVLSTSSAMSTSGRPISGIPYDPIMDPLVPPPPTGDPFAPLPQKSRNVHTCRNVGTAFNESPSGGRMSLESLRDHSANSHHRSLETPLEARPADSRLALIAAPGRQQAFSAHCNGALHPIPTLVSGQAFRRKSDCGRGLAHRLACRIARHHMGDAVAAGRAGIRPRPTWLLLRATVARHINY